MIMMETDKKSAAQAKKSWLYRRSIMMRFLRCDLGRIFALGSLLLICGISVLGLLAYFNHPSWQHIFTMAVAHMIAGKAVSVVQGLALGLHPVTILFLAAYSDIVLMLIAYPLVVFSYEHFFESKLFQQRMRPMFESARKRMDHVGRFKALGVFILVWLPLWMTGVLVGSILGYLLGLRAWVTFMAAGLGTLTSIVAWLCFSNQIISAAGWVDDPHAGIIVFLLVLALLLWRHFKHRRRENSGKRIVHG